jgi:hypothetical protein
MLFIVKLNSYVCRNIEYLKANLLFIGGDERKTMVPKPGFEPGQAYAH